MTRASWVAADLIAQAEHDPDARAVLITPNRRLAERTANEVDRQIPSAGPARESLRAHGGIIVTRTINEAIELANASAAEHLVVDDDGMAKQVRCAGSLFVGPWSAQVAGDYAIGTNHVLPTAGAARVRGGLSGADFVRQITVQRVTTAGLRRIGNTVVTLANAEGLQAHGRLYRAASAQTSRTAMREEAEFAAGFAGICAITLIYVTITLIYITVM